MKLSQILSVGLAALTAVAVSTPNVQAHNTAKYAAVPFVVPAFCSTATARWVNRGGSLAIQITNPNDDAAGFEVFNSVPSSNSGVPSVAAGTVPAGTYSFTVSGLPSTGTYAYFGYVNTSGTYTYFTGIDDDLIYNGTYSGAVPSGAVAVVAFIYNDGATLFTTMYLSNFRLNNAPILSDTTQSTSSTSNPFGYCY